jgi:hypothetical protein
VQRKCDCGRLFEDEGYRTLCFQCFNLKRYKEATKLPFKANSLGQRDSGVAELKPSNLCSSPDATKTLGFSDEAALLESCWVKVHEFKLKPSEEQAASLCGMLFISLSKTQHIKEMKR